ncbi:MAG: sulfatase [Phycisphaerales bacterium]|nr:MAG: sulfatase [Phycisphaerales bacterium]
MNHRLPRCQARLLPAYGAGLRWLFVLLAVAGCERTGEGTLPAKPEADAGRTRGEDPRPNILLITVCTFRYDHMSAAGYPRPTTPFLDSLAAGGVFFENAVSSSSWTKPAVASILTGLTPNVHRMTDSYKDEEIRGVGFTPKRTLSDGVVTLAECLREVGYETGYQNNNIHAGRFFNMTQGFDDAGFHDYQVDTPRMLAEFAAWVRRLDRNKPFFFFLLTRDPHLTYDPHYEYYHKFDRSSPPVARHGYSGFLFARAVRTEIQKRLKDKQPPGREYEQRWIDLYDAELAQLDDVLRAVPVILAEAGRQSNTVIVVTGDHGERFFDGLTKNIGHSGALDEPVLHVPLLICGPGIPAGRRINRIVRSIDIYPTVAELARADVPDLVQGESLLPFLFGDAEALAPRTAFASYAETRHAVRDGNFKLHYANGAAQALYDLQSDPAESLNRLDAESEVAARLERRVLGWLDQERALQEIISEGRAREMTPEVIEQLRSLGYVQ